MELIDAFDTALTEFDRQVHLVGAGQWHARTACEEWNARDLVNHLVSEHLWAPQLLGGATLEEVGDRFDGDVVGDEPVAAWERASAGSKPAFHRPGALEGSVWVTGGQAPASVYGWQMTTDLAVHAWDLAQGIGTTAALPDDLAEALHRRAAPQLGAGGVPGIFEPPVPVPDSATPQERLLALLGRQP